LSSPSECLASLPHSTEAELGCDSRTSSWGGRRRSGDCPCAASTLVPGGKRPGGPAEPSSTPAASAHCGRSPFWAVGASSRVAKLAFRGPDHEPMRVEHRQPVAGSVVDHRQGGGRLGSAEARHDLGAASGRKREFAVRRVAVDHEVAESSLRNGRLRQRDVSVAVRHSGPTQQRDRWDWDGCRAAHAWHARPALQATTARPRAPISAERFEPDHARRNQPVGRRAR